MKINKCLMVSFGVVALAACATGPMPMVTQFSPETQEACSGTGTGTITGQAFRRTLGGDVRYAAGNEVILMAADAHTREFAQRLSQGQSVEADARIDDYIRTTIADDEGEFRFNNLPPCRYIVIAHVFWQVPDPLYPNQGGVLADEVTVSEGETVELILTR